MTSASCWIPSDFTLWSDGAEQIGIADPDPASRAQWTEAVLAVAASAPYAVTVITDITALAGDHRVARYCDDTTALLRELLQVVSRRRPLIRANPGRFIPGPGQPLPLFLLDGDSTAAAAGGAALLDSAAAWCRKTGVAVAVVRSADGPGLSPRTRTQIRWDGPDVDVPPGSEPAVAEYTDAAVTGAARPARAGQ